MIDDEAKSWAEMLDREGSAIRMSIKYTQEQLGLSFDWDTTTNQEKNRVELLADDSDLFRDEGQIEFLECLLPYLERRKKQALLALRTIKLQLKIYQETEHPVITPARKHMPADMVLGTMINIRSNSLSRLGPDICTINMFNESHRWPTLIRDQWIKDEFNEESLFITPSGWRSWTLCTPNDWDLLDWMFSKQELPYRIQRIPPYHLGKAHRILLLDLPHESYVWWMKAKFRGDLVKTSKLTYIPREHPEGMTAFWVDHNTTILTRHLKLLQKRMPQDILSLFLNEGQPQDPT